MMPRKHRQTKNTVLLISDRFYPENFLVNSLVNNWDRSGIHVDVLTQIPSYPFDKPYKGFSQAYRQRLSPRVRIRRTKTTLGYSRSVVRKVFGYLTFMVRASLTAICEFRFHRVVFVYHTGPLTQAFPVVLLKLLRRCDRAVIWTQDVWPDAVHAFGLSQTGAGARILELFVRWVYHNFDHVLVSSPRFIDRLRNYVPRHIPIEFVPQWVPEDFDLTKESNFDPDEVPESTKFVFTGNLGTMQNLDRIVDAFQGISTQDAVLYIVGDGTQRNRLETKVLSRHQTNVRFVGSYPLKTIKRIIQACDFSLLSLVDDPSISMTIPAKFTTYLSAQRPIVCVSKGEVQRIVARTKIGLVADPSDTASITRVIKQAITSLPAERVAWSENMKHLQESEFSKDRSISSINRALFGKND